MHVPNFESTVWVTLSPWKVTRWIDCKWLYCNQITENYRPAVTGYSAANWEMRETDGERGGNKWGCPSFPQLIFVDGGWRLVLGRNSGQNSTQRSGREERQMTLHRLSYRGKRRRVIGRGGGKVHSAKDRKRGRKISKRSETQLKLQGIIIWKE